MTKLKNLNYENLIEKKKILLPENSDNKKTLILDLDETLVHADFDNIYKNHDFQINFKYEDEEIQVKILIRPGFQEFLESMSEHFEIFVFTASIKEYADAVLNYLDPENKFFKMRFYRSQCISIMKKVYIKDLRIFQNRKLENIIIVDNSIYAFSNQISNGVLINSFYDDKMDRELLNLGLYLKNYFKECEDIRRINGDIFNFETIMNEFLYDVR